ncbi:flavin reductase family protein [Streptomyces yangpuensis]|uniref:Flavin reductase family protein n=1 Tax=Streptomyces yangpuensis TaxID=1648182 RepID=A0ABY5Q7Q1_9ACTN|nr:flavin reductase family protein [Streptomyces yangpuensis]UUY52492.1 flavin reductase family protein [Streptomyces yangpuensis]
MPTPASTTLEKPVDPLAFRHVLGHFCSGVTIITGVEDGPPGPAPAGFTCQSFASLSLDPPLVTFSVAKTSRTWPRIAPTGGFCVNLLAVEQEDLCRSFAVSGADKFAGVEWSPAPVTGSPVLAGSLGWIDCTVEAVHPGGDHWLVLGRVLGLDTVPAVTEAEPLLYYRSAFRRPAA